MINNDYRSAAGGAKSFVEAPSRMTVANVDTGGSRVQLAPTWSERINSMRTSNAKSSNDTKTTTFIFPATSKRAALLSVKVDADGEMSPTSKQTSISNDEKSPAEEEMTSCLKVEEPKTAAVNFEVELNPISDEVKFCSVLNDDVTDKLNDEDDGNDQSTNLADDVIDHVTTISVDVHAMESLRGAVKVSPVSSAGMDCSCEDSCACSSFDSDDDRNDDHEPTTTTISIACQTDTVDRKPMKALSSSNVCRASKKIRNVAPTNEGESLAIPMVTYNNRAYTNLE